MDEQLTRLYQDELMHLREMGREFAHEHPKIARRLGMENMEVADPYVERLLEGFAFLAARVHLQLDAEQPQLIAQLLESMAPNFLAPLPSMMVARLAVDTADPNLAGGYIVPRGAAVVSKLARGQNTLCEFRTAMAVTLWPVEIADIRYFTLAPDLGLARLPTGQPCRGGLRVRLRVGSGLPWAALGLNRLAFYISAADDVAYRLHELVLGNGLGSLVVDPAAPTAGRWRGEDSVRALGFGADEALLPESLRGFSGHRLLQEVAALPQRLMFFEVTDLAPRLADMRGPEIELVLPFARGDAALEPLVDSTSLSLFCTPAINRFGKRLDRVALGPGGWEYHVVADRSRPMDFEVHSVESVAGHAAGGERVVEFKPLYACHHEVPAPEQGYYTVRREPRMPSERQRQQGARVPSYLGEEVYLSLADPGHGPYRDSLRQLSVQAWVTNRDLPVLLPQPGDAEAGAWQLDTPGPVVGVSSLRGPTRPVSRRPQGRIGWQLVALLSQHHLALGDDAQASAAALRDMLLLFGPPGDATWRHQCEGIRTLRARPVVRSLPFPGRLTHGWGVEITLEVDEQHFQGASAFLLGLALEGFVARHVAINSFTQFTLVSAQRGVIKRWPQRVGQRQIL